MALINGTVVKWNLDPRLFYIPSSIDEVDIQDYLDTARKEHEHNLMNMWADHLVDAAGKDYLAPGKAVGVTLTNNNVKAAFLFDPNPTSNGSITTPDTTGEIIIDSGATFQTDGVTPGAWVMNLTDVSISFVVSVDSQIQITCYPLGGGTDNQWESSDNYVIYNVTQKRVFGGNFLAVDGNGDPMSPILPTPLTQVIIELSSSPTQIISGSGVTAQDKTDIIDGVWEHADAVSLLADIVTLQGLMTRTLGLTQENQAIDQMVYTDGRLTASRIRIYSSAGSVGTDSDVIATYNMSASYDGENLDSYQVVKA